MKPEHTLTGRQARRRAAWYRARVFARLFLARVVAPSMVTAWPAVGLFWWLGLGDFTATAYLQAVEHGIAALAALRWWHAERTAAVARQLYLDTRQGPLGTGR